MQQLFCQCRIRFHQKMKRSNSHLVSVRSPATCPRSIKALLLQLQLAGLLMQLRFTAAAERAAFSLGRLSRNLWLARHAPCPACVLRPASPSPSLTAPQLLLNSGAASGEGRPRSCGLTAQRFSHSFSFSTTAGTVGDLVIAAERHNTAFSPSALLISITWGIVSGIRGRNDPDEGNARAIERGPGRRYRGGLLAPGRRRRRTA
ncbi:hypothetical protein ACVWZW_003981 [Bradyrhizobium sp. F1.13.4]